MVTSRSFEEYVAFFDLDPERLPRTIIDVSAGASGFTAEANRRAAQAVAADPAYALGDAELRAVVRDSVAQGACMIEENRVRFTYDWYGGADRRTHLRAAALSDFLTDRAVHPERYVTAELPTLPFPDASFDLALCSHLLFTWSQVFDAAWHQAALAELLRVSAEVRVFPLALRGSGAEIPFLSEVLDQVRRTGANVEVRETSYEFQTGVRDVLIVTRPSLP